MAHTAASDPGDPTPADLLRAAEHEVVAARASEVRQYQLLLAWADLHSGDPQDQPGAVPARRGGPKLTYPGNAGTPGLVDLCLPEIAAARGESPGTCRNTLRAALDLRHRFPATWHHVQALVLPVWVARKVTTLARDLTLAQAALVDQAVAEAAAESPGRVLEIAEAKTIEADPDAHRERLELTARTRGVWLHHPRAGEERLHNPGLTTIIARLETGDAATFDAAITEIAALLEEHATEQDTQIEHGEPLGLNHWRSEALALLADPAAALAFLQRCHGQTPIHDDPPPAPAEQQAPPTEDERDESEAPADDALEPITSAAAAAEAAPDPRPEPAAPAPAQQPPARRGTARMFVHLGLDPDGLLGPVARVEGLGPMLTTQLADLLRHHDITLTPVIDLHEGRSVNGYEHPTDIRERVTLRTTGSVFPHATDHTNHAGRPPDLDHVTPYESPRTGGPPGQTGDHNTAPLQRLTHRAKTHLGYQAHQTGPNTWIWRTPHGLHRLVDHTGTHRITRLEYALLRHGAQVQLAEDLRGTS